MAAINVYFIICFLWSMHLRTVFLWGSEKPNFKQNIFLLALIKNRLKVHEKNISRECTINIDQCKPFSENCSQKALGVWLWLVFKITENKCRSRILAKFFQTVKEVSYTWHMYSNLKVIPVILSQNVSSAPNYLRTYTLRNISHLSATLMITNRGWS